MKGETRINIFEEFEKWRKLNSSLNIPHVRDQKEGLIIYISIQLTLDMYLKDILGRLVKN